MKNLITFWLLILTSMIFITSSYGLKATLGSYWSVPTTVYEASETGWELDDPEKGCYNFGKYNGYRWVEKNNTAIGLLFNWDGDLCGVQMMVDYEIFEDENTYEFYMEPMYQVSSVGRKLYWTLTAYFCHPSTICDGDTCADDDRFTTTLYYQNGVTPSDENLLEVPYERTDAFEAGWSNENCFDGMGHHNVWYAWEFKQYDCTRFLPTLLLFDNYGKRQGFGFWVMGQSKNTSDRLEKPPGEIVKIIMGDDGPDCIVNNGTTTVHFFSIDDPANFKCSAEM